jgi:hypothetical protein
MKIEGVDHALLINHSKVTSILVEFMHDIE